MPEALSYIPEEYRSKWPLPEEQKIAKKPSEKPKKKIEFDTQAGLAVVVPEEKIYTIEELGGKEIKEREERDWQKMAKDKSLQAHNLIEELQTKYKNKKADQEDPLYKQWLLVRGQVKQAEMISAAQKKLAESTRHLETVTKKMKKYTTLEEDFLSLGEEEEKLKLEMEILPLQITTLTEDFDSTELKIAVWELEMLPEIPPPPIKEELRRLSLKEEAEETAAEKDVELVRRIQEMAKKLVEAEDQLEKARAGRKNLFRRWFSGLIYGKELPEEKEFAKINQDYQAAQIDYEEAWAAYDTHHQLSSAEKKAFQKAALKFATLKTVGRSAPFGSISESR